MYPDPRGYWPTGPHQQPEPEPDEFPDKTAASIYTWRFAQLWDAGYDSEVAELLAKSTADLHKLVDAKKAGCSDEQALIIFL